MKSTPLWLASLTLLASCVTGGPATEGFCTVSSPILISKADVLTKGTAQQILGHNAYGADKCGWKHP